jgi:hypothetical protein
VFGLLRPSHGLVKYLVIVTLTDSYDKKTNTNWRIARFEENPGRLFEIQHPDIIQEYFGTVIWYASNPNPSTTAYYRRGHKFIKMPFRVQYKSGYVPVLHSILGGWLPTRPPANCFRPLDESAEYITRIRRRVENKHFNITDEVIVPEAVAVTVSVVPQSVTEKVPSVYSKIPKYVYENHVIAEKSKGTECPISMTPLSEITLITVTNCFHIFDTPSFNDWYKTNKKCPVCRVCVEFTVCCGEP